MAMGLSAQSRILQARPGVTQSRTGLPAEGPFLHIAIAAGDSRIPAGVPDIACFFSWLTNHSLKPGQGKSTISDRSSTRPFRSGAN